MLISVSVLTTGEDLFSARVVPEFTWPIQNVTVAVGREAVLSCSITDLGDYKVSQIFEIKIQGVHLKLKIQGDFKSFEKITSQLNCRS